MEIPAIDTHAMIWVSQHQSAFMDVFFSAVTWAGSLFVLLPLAVCLAGYLHRDLSGAPAPAQLQERIGR